MNAEVNQALKLIRRKTPKIASGTINNTYERGIFEYLIHLAFDQSNPRKLWKAVRFAAIDQLGIGATEEQVDNESDNCFHYVVKLHFPELTSSQVEALYRSFELASSKKRFANCA
jgi:hypothetical protein